MKTKEIGLWDQALKFAARQDLKNLEEIVHKLSCLDSEKKAKIETKKLMKAC